jgi:nitroreductase
MQPDEGFAAAFEKAVSIALAKRGGGEGALLAVSEPALVQGIKERATRGLVSKINFWLPRNPVIGFLVLAVPRRDACSLRPLETPLAALAAEDVVLWLTERGLGTCWLGGFSQREVGEVLGLGGDVAVPAIIPLGRPKERVQARDFDNLVYRRISRHRKPLTTIAYLEDMGHPYVLPDLAGTTFSASSTQDVLGLLGRMAEVEKSKEDVPIDLALDACLEAARVAPSASNAQQWKFVVVREEKALLDLAGACHAPVPWRAAVVGVGQRGRMETAFEKPFWMLDLPIAFSNMSLMAASMDLALDLYLRDFDEEAVNGMVKLEPPLRTVGVMGIR